MIRAKIFDLDGTLVQTERLKAQSYARAVADVCGNKISEVEVIDAFRDVVGRLTRQAIHAQGLVEERWIVDNPITLTAVVEQMIADRKET